MPVSSVQRLAGTFISVPASLRISADCMNLLEAMLKADPAERITLGRIREHPWFLVSLPLELQARRTAGQGQAQDQEVLAVRGWGQGQGQGQGPAHLRSMSLLCGAGFLQRLQGTMSPMAVEKRQGVLTCGRPLRLQCLSARRC